MHYDVIIVGGGPAGASAGIQLCKKSNSVAIIASKRRHGSSTDVIYPDVKQELRLLGMEQDALISFGVACHAIRASWGTSTPIVQSFLGNPYGDSFIVDRQMFDTALLQLAIKAGARTVNATFREAVHDGTNWHVTYQDTIGSHVLTGSVLIDATGRSAAVARKIGIAISSYDRLVGISAIVPQPCPQVLQVIAAQEGWWYTIPSGPDQTFACLITDADIARNLKAGTIPGWIELARCTLPMLSQVQPAKLDVHACHSAALQEMGKHWIAVGDAAASYDPLSGIGILHALRSARHAANAIIQLLNGDTNAIELYAVEERYTFGKYLMRRSKHYSLEQRFSNHQFWIRRNINKSSNTPKQVAGEEGQKAKALPDVLPQN